MRQDLKGLHDARWLLIYHEGPLTVPALPLLWRGELQLL